MALIKLGAFITQISGKVGGQSFATGKGGSYIKNIGSYTVRQNALTSSKLLNFSFLAGQWRLLTNSQRAGWTEEALNHPYQNRVNETKFYSGYILFIKFNGNLIQAGDTFKPDPPGSITFIPSFGWEVVEIDNVYFLQNPTSEANTYYSFQMSGPVNAGTGPAGLTFKQVLKGETPLTSQNTDIETGYISAYGTMLVGFRYHYKLHLISKTTGQDLQNVLVGFYDYSEP